MELIENLKKLRLKESPVFYNVPEDFKNALEEISNKEAKAPFQAVVAFINNKEELISFFEKELPNIEYDAKLWIVYPKQSAKMKTDINRDIIWKSGINYELRPVSIVSLSEKWSGLRMRPIEAVK